MCIPDQFRLQGGGGKTGRNLGSKTTRASRWANVFVVVVFKGYYVLMEPLVTVPFFLKKKSVRRGKSWGFGLGEKWGERIEEIFFSSGGKRQKAKTEKERKKVLITYI